MGKSKKGYEPSETVPPPVDSCSHFTKKVPLRRDGKVIDLDFCIYCYRHFFNGEEHVSVKATWDAYKLHTSNRKASTPA